MSRPSTASRQNRITKILILRKALVKRHQLVVAGHAERGQIRIVPDVVREGVEFGSLTPQALQVVRFGGVADSRIEQRTIVNGPSLT